MSIGLILVILLVLILLGGLPQFGYGYSHGPIGLVGIVLIIILVVLLFGGRL